MWPSYIQNVTRSEQKLHHSACSCPRRLRVWGRSKFTKHSLALQAKALHFFFWISHCMLAVGALEDWTWWPHLAKFRLDVLIVEFSGSDFFPRIWSHGERERERERGGGGGRGQGVRDWTELTAGVNSAFSSMPNDMLAGERQASRLERELKCKSEESDKAHRSVPTSCPDPLESKLGLSYMSLLASLLSGPHERRPMASRKEQLSSLFFAAWTTWPLHEKLSMGFKRAKFTQRNTNRPKNIFVDDRLRGHHPRALNNVSAEGFIREAKRARRSVEFNFFINCGRQKRFSQNERRRADLQKKPQIF